MGYLRGTKKSTSTGYGTTKRRRGTIPTRGYMLAKTKTRKRRKRNLYKRKRFSSAKLYKMNRQLRNVTRKVKNDQAYHTFKLADSNRFVIANIGECLHSQVAAISTTSQETAMANLRYYNPSVPGTLVTANAATGTYSRIVHIESMTTKLNIRNNYQVPCIVTVYCCKPKQDTNVAVLTYYSDGATDQVISGGSVVTPPLYITDIDLVNESWKVKKLKKRYLRPGDEITVRHSEYNIDYDPSMVDTHNLAYQAKYKNYALITRLEGVIAHDTAADESAMYLAGIDTQYTHIYKFIYDAGVNLNDIFIDDNRDQSFTNGGVVSNMPIADNQSYSVA